jgi:hypothetical protein
MITIKSPKISKKFQCIKCDYTSSKPSEYNKHLLTAKHKMITNGNKKSPKNLQSICQRCKKCFKYSSGLSRHNKICRTISSYPANDSTDTNTNDTYYADTNVLVSILKQNQDFKQLMIEQNKQMQYLQTKNESLQEQLVEAVKLSGNNIHNQIINNNQKFNLNFFLNTTCKDAMNMSEFIETINVNFKDIESIGKDGYVSGMTNIILSRIKDLDITKRPLHCTDLKRETMYIKDNGEWCKDSPNNSKLRSMITIVAKQNYNVVPSWRIEHPECNVCEHPTYNLCIDMMRNIIGDVGMAHSRLDNKVIKNISKSIMIK